MGDIDGNITQGYIDEYEKLAKGGVKYIITSHFCIDRDYRANGNQVVMDDTADKNRMRELVTVAHNYSSKIFAQISHAGDKSPFNAFDINTVSTEELEQVVETFIHAASIAKDVGFDGVQLHLAHGYLFSSILDPYQNERSDAYGGSKEKRFALIKRIVTSIREQCGKDFMILVKLNSNNSKRTEYSNQLLYNGKQLELAGCDAIELSGFGSAIEAKEKTAPYFLPEALLLQESVSIPVILVGGFNSMELIREVRKKGIPFVSLSRAFIRQPDLLLLDEEKQFTCIQCSKCFGAIRTMHKRCIFDSQENEQAKILYPNS